MENMLLNGLFSVERLPELKAYAKMLPDDSVAPKQMILEVIEYMEEEQKKIAMLQSQAEIMQQNAQQFLMGDDEMQSQQIADAMNQIDMERAEAEEELPEEESVTE